jgi:hypothetical protein
MNKRVLLDENVPHGLRLLLSGHTVITAAYQGWAGKKNGALVALAEENAFDVMVTADQGLNYQQNMKGRKLALLVLSSGNKRFILANAPHILAAISAAQAGSYTLVDIHH